MKIFIALELFFEDKHTGKWARKFVSHTAAVKHFLSTSSCSAPLHIVH